MLVSLVRIWSNRPVDAMNNIKKIGLLLLVLGVKTGFTQAAQEARPDATLQLSGGSVAAGIGWSWGSGTLTYKGKNFSLP